MFSAAAGLATNKTGSGERLFHGQNGMGKRERHVTQPPGAKTARKKRAKMTPRTRRSPKAARRALIGRAPFNVRHTNGMWPAATAAGRSFCTPAPPRPKNRVTLPLRGFGRPGCAVLQKRPRAPRAARSPAFPRARPGRGREMYFRDPPRVCAITKGLSRTKRAQ